VPINKVIWEHLWIFHIHARQVLVMWSCIADNQLLVKNLLSFPAIHMSVAKSPPQKGTAWSKVTGSLHSAYWQVSIP